ncbi:MAG: alginate O-acetyltransferase AlgX-related protein [Planctomycetota bacterium]
MTEVKRKHIFLTTAFLVIIFSVSLTQTGIELSRGQKPLFADLFLQKPTKANLRAFEKELEEASWFSQKLRPWMQYLRFVVLKDTGEKAVIGKEGWLFYKPSVQYLTQRWPAAVSSDGQKGNCLSAILSFREQLAARGIKLLVVPVPNKASIYPEKLTSRASRTKQPVNPYTLEAITELKKAGVEVVNLFEIFSEARATGTSSRDAGYYLSQDTHWSPRGMRTAAKVVARRILALGWAEKGTVEYDLKPVTIERYGDVLRMIRVPQIESCFIPQKIHCTQVAGTDSGRLYQDDPNSQILVLGDSFLRIYEQDEPGSAGFIAHLARELGSPLASIVNDGGASTLVRQQLNQRPALLTSKKVVIWEFVERDICFGTEGWQQVPLPAATTESMANE